ncbi:MAG TPA: hypothetical protein PK904_14475 [Bacteroidales bacterium]|nr:hypothetical protein [Bacteroidales bacterium]
MKEKLIDQYLYDLDELIEKIKDNISEKQLLTLLNTRKKLNENRAKENLVSIIDLLIKLLLLGTNMFKDGF